jgi:hypothetical protein
MYRRWGGRRGLVADAVEAFAAGAVQVPDTGKVQEDLRWWARSIVAMLTARDSAAVVRALFSTNETPEIRDLRRRFYRTRSAMVVPIAERAVARGELPAGTDAAEVIRQVGAPALLPVPGHRRAADRCRRRPGGRRRPGRGARRRVRRRRHGQRRAGLTGSPVGR